MTGPRSAAGSGAAGPVAVAAQQSVSWAETLAAVLVGTDRRPLPDSLDVLAAQALHRRAGAIPDPAPPLPDPAPPEHEDLAGPAAATRLGDMLAGAVGHVDSEGRAELVTEWLEQGRLVPGELLPDLLDLGRNHRSIRAMLLRAGGERVRWLAAQRANWGYLHRSDDTDAEFTDVKEWQLAPIGPRSRQLRGLRGRDPEAGRDLLASVWEKEAPEDRSALLLTLETGLSPADEPLLATALGDRRKEVRKIAAALLLKVPGSEFGKALADRVRRHVRISGDRVVIEPPADCDGELQRFGVQPKPPQGVGPRAWWLEELVARTPLSTWTDDGLAARSLPTTTVTAEWKGAFRQGLARAAAAQGDGDWAAAVLDGLQSGGGERLDNRLLLEALYQALRPEVAAERAARMLLDDPRSAVGAGLDQLLRHCPRPWPASLAGPLRMALGTLMFDRTPRWRLLELCRLAGVRLPPSTVDEFADLAGEDPVNVLTDILRFRHDMLEELA